MMDDKRGSGTVKEEYRRPGSRFDRMLELVERGACAEEFCDVFGEKENASVYPVIQAIVSGTLSTGGDGTGYSIDRMQPAAAIDRALYKQERQDKVFRMLDAGMTNKQIQVDTGMSRGGVEYIKAKWAVARGIARKKGA